MIAVEFQQYNKDSESILEFIFELIGFPSRVIFATDFTDSHSFSYFLKPLCFFVSFPGTCTRGRCVVS